MPQFEPGQVWTYRTRPDEEASRVIVCRVDSHETDNAIIHIFVEGVAIAGAHTAISHAPIYEKALRESVLSLESMCESLPGYGAACGTTRSSCSRPIMVWPWAATDFSGMLEQLEDWQRRTDDPHPLHVDEPVSAKVDLTRRKRKPDDHQPAWIVEKYFGDKEGK